MLPLRLVPPAKAPADPWQALAARYYHKVVISLVAGGVALERALDLTQDTWLTLFEKRKTLTPNSPGIAFTQANFLALREHRANGRDKKRFVGEVLDTLAASGDSAEAKLLNEEQLGLALVALNSCPAGARRVFDMVYDNPDLSHAAIAKDLGVSVQYVRQSLCAVRRRLRDTMERGHD